MDALSPYIGKIGGIEVQLHWSFVMLLLFILLTSAYYFMLWVLLFACVLVHELTHSITSRRNGIEVRKIVLYPFGGGSIIDFEKVTPELEFKISIVGPIASLLLACVFGMVAVCAPAGMIRYTAQMLFELNVFLGVFNILPWLPLDGGRALRSWLWERMDYYEATKEAAMVGNVVTVLFLFGTLAYVMLTPGSFLNKEFILFWDIIMAMFIYSGAKGELQNAYIKENITGLRVSNAMSKSCIEVSERTTAQELYRTMLKHHTHIVLFREGGAVKVVNLPFGKLPWKGRALNDIRQFGVAVPEVQYDAQLYSAIERMRSSESSILVVMKQRKLDGVLLLPQVESIVMLYLSHKKAGKR